MTATRNAARKARAARNDERAAAAWTCIGLCVEAKVPVMLWGDPGIGKSAQVAKLPSILDSVSDVIATSVANRENVDFNGVINVREDGFSTYSAFTWVEKLTGDAVEGKAPLWFIDEVTTGDESVQKALLRPVQERMVGDTPISDDVAIVLAGNDPSVAADGNYLAPPLANRCAHFELKLDASGWLNGLLTGFAESTPPVDVTVFAADPASNYTQAAYIVSSFIEANQQMLNPGVPTEAKKSSKAWASGRSWHNLARVLAHLDLVEDNVEYVRSLAAAFIGDAARDFASYFLACLNYDLPKVLSREQSVKWRSESSVVLNALVRAITRLGCSGDPDLWEAAEDLMTNAYDNGRRDLAAAGLVQLCSAIPEGAHSSTEALAIMADLDDTVALVGA